MMRSEEEPWAWVWAAGMVVVRLELLAVRLVGAGCGRSCCCVTEDAWVLLVRLVLPLALSDGWASTVAFGTADLEVGVWLAVLLLMFPALLLLSRREASIRVSR